MFYKNKILFNKKNLLIKQRKNKLTSRYNGFIVNILLDFYNNIKEFFEWNVWVGGLLGSYLTTTIAC